MRLNIVLIVVCFCAIFNINAQSVKVDFGPRVEAMSKSPRLVDVKDCEVSLSSFIGNIENISMEKLSCDLQPVIQIKRKRTSGDLKFENAFDESTGKFHARRDPRMFYRAENSYLKIANVINNQSGRKEQLVGVLYNKQSFAQEKIVTLIEDGGKPNQKAVAKIITTKNSYFYKVFEDQKKIVVCDLKNGGSVQKGVMKVTIFDFELNELKSFTMNVPKEFSSDNWIDLSYSEKLGVALLWKSEYSYKLKPVDYHLQSIDFKSNKKSDFHWDNQLLDIQKIIFNEGGEIIAIGKKIKNDKKIYGYVGEYFVKFNRSDLTILSENNYEFGKKDLDKFYGKRGTKKFLVHKLKLKEIRLLRNNKILAISEITSLSATSLEPITSTADLLISVFDSEGVLIRNHILKKYQSYAGFIGLTSYVSFLKEGKLLVVYNEDARDLDREKDFEKRFYGATNKRPNQVGVTCFSLDLNTGEFEKEILIKNEVFKGDCFMGVAGINTACVIKESESKYILYINRSKKEIEVVTLSI